MAKEIRKFKSARLVFSDPQLPDNGDVTGAVFETPAGVSWQVRLDEKGDLVVEPFKPKEKDPA